MGLEGFERLLESFFCSSYDGDVGTLFDELDSDR